MNKSARRGVGFQSRLLIAAAFLPVATLAGAQQARASGSAIEGHWSLVSVINEKDGQKSEPMGPNPLGLFIYDRSGRYAIQLYKPGIPPIASNDRNKGTSEEYKAIMSASLAHYGTYTVDEKAGTVTVRPVAGTFPNWVGKDLPRKFEVDGDQLKIFNPSSSGDPSSKAYLVLKRAR